MKYICIVLLSCCTIACTKTTYVEGMLPVDSTVNTTIAADTSFYNAVDSGLFSLSNVWKSTFSSKIEKMYVHADDAYYLGFQSGTTYTFLSVSLSGQTVFIDESLVDVAGYNSKWVLEYLDGQDVYRIRNYHTQNYLNVETGSWTTGAILSGWLSAQWYIQ